MIELRIHGRGGQGSVTAAYLLAIAAFTEGYEVQAFPYFGVERRGAPVQAYVRISKKPIRLREHVYHPEVLIIQDPTLFDSVDVFQGAHKDTKVIINSEKSIKELGLPSNFKILTVPAVKIALDTIKKPIINTVMLGAFGSISGLLKFSSIRQAIDQNFPPALAKVNIKAANTAFCQAQPGHKYYRLTSDVCNISQNDRDQLNMQCR